MANDLEKKIIRQVEYYFSDVNLVRDKFLQEKIKGDADGWVTLDVLLTFKRLASLSTDKELIANAVEKSDAKAVVVSEDRLKLRRTPDKPIPELNEEFREEFQKKTAYAKGFPLDEKLDTIMEFLKDHGPVISCQLRSFINRTTKESQFKGSCFIVFEDPDTAKKFIEAEEIKYKDQPLLRKWQKAYWEEKTEERKANQMQRKQNNEKAGEAPKIDIPKGAIMSFDGVPEGKTLNFADMKARIKEVGEGTETAYVELRRGDTKGYIRLQKENDAVEFHKKLTDGKLTISEMELTLKVLDGEDEETYIKQVHSDLSKHRAKNNHQGKKRRGNFRNDGSRNKHRKQ